MYILLYMFNLKSRISGVNRLRYAYIYNMGVTIVYAHCKDP